MGSYLDMVAGICVIGCLLVTGGAVLIYRYKVNRTYRRLDRMLSDAMGGCFTEQHFDETRLSALEARWAQYLSASDLNARRQAEERDKIKTLISDISHQTKTPISNISLYSELLLEQELPAEAKQYAGAMNEQAKKLSFLISALVKMSRLETGILTLQPRQGSVEKLLQEVYQQMLPKAKEKGLKLILEQGEEKGLEMLPGHMGKKGSELIAEQTEAEGAELISECGSAHDWAVFDGKWTIEAVTNIVDNAVKYTDRGSVTLRICPYRLFCCIQIRDTGMGIPEEEQARIFARFYRGDAAAGTEGVGIGLYLAREILSAEGGYIKVTSHPGEGSVFSVYLPR